MTRDLFAEIHLGRPISAHGLAVVPIFPRREPVALAEPSDAIARGLLRIDEHATETVPALRAVNGGALPVLVPEGSLLLGGLQDRISVRPTWVPVGGEATIEVQCVEQGRWRARAADGRSFRVERAHVGFRHERLRDDADQGRTWALVGARRRARGRSDVGGSLRELRDDATIERDAADLALPWAASGAMVCWDHPDATSWPLVEFWSCPEAFRAAWPLIARSALEAHRELLARRGAAATRAPWIGLSDATARLEKVAAASVAGAVALGVDVQAARLYGRGVQRTIEGWVTGTRDRLLHLGAVRG